MRRRASLASCLFLAAALSGGADAVPIPWRNCGRPGDLMVITQADASVWPPPVAAPASATATFDSAGNLVNLRLFLIHGVPWTFDSGPLPTTTTAGFVSLPASFPVKVTSATLPLTAGRYSTMIQETSDVPALSRASVVMLAVMLFAMALWIARRRNIGALDQDHDIR